LVKELASRPANMDWGEQIREQLKAGNFDQALQLARTITNDYFSSDIGMDVEKKICYLVSLCGDLRGQYSVESIRSNRMMRADTAKVETSFQVDIETHDLITKPVECPIIMDQDVPQIMILDLGEPILANVDKNIVDDIANCPLRLLNYPELVTKLKKSISQWTGTKINQYLEFNPFTKQKLLGTIPLGGCGQHVKCGDYTMSWLFSAGKILGNINLYYGVIWHLIKSGEFEYLNEIKDQVTEHLIWRLTNSKTNASLCGLPQFVLTKVPTDVAIWYTVNSCLLNQPTDRDTIRFHLFNLDVMLDIIKEFKYPISPKTIQQINRVKVLMSMLSAIKKNQIGFTNRIRCLYQNAIHIDINQVPEKVKQIEKVFEWIPIDGPASNQQTESILKTFPQFYRELTVKELIGLAQLVSPSKSASDITLETTWTPTSLTDSKINWLYGLEEIPFEPIKISPVTFRPYYMVNHHNSTVPWNQIVNNLYGTVDNNKIFSAYRKFLDYFNKYEEFPNLESYLLFCFNRYANKCGVNATLPYQVAKFYNDVITSYKPILKIIMENKITPEQIIKILNTYAPVENRVKAEYSISNITDQLN
jgi:hypothetical protein